MAYQYKTITYGSSDGIATVTAHFFLPEKTPIRAIVQLSHGLCDYVARYAPLAEALTERGYALCGNDALGHGKTARHSDDIGFSTMEDGADTVVTDLHKMTLLLRAKYKGTPIILLGAGLGSYPVRMYAQSYYRDIDGIILANAANLKHPRMAKMLARTIANKYGEKHKSPFFEHRVFGKVNSRFNKKDPYGVDWINRSGEIVADLVIDPYTNFHPTVTAYYDLFVMADRAGMASFVKNYSKNLPILLLAGDADPISHRGRDVAVLSARLTAAGCRDVIEKHYDGARYDLLMETCRDTCYGDILLWLDRRF